MHLFTIVLLTTFVLPAYTFPYPPTHLLHSREVTNSSKAGLTSPSPKAVEKFTGPTNKVSWYYTWSPSAWEAANAQVNRTIEFVPMLWGQKQVEDFNATIRETIAELNVTHLLGMNEPQEKGQANLTPQQGVDMWISYIEPLKALGLRLGSPAPSSAPSGMTWITEFLELCAGRCSVDFIGLHYYDVNATDFIEYMTEFHDVFQRPIWVTEWACQNFNKVKEQCSNDDTVLFLNATQSWLDETPWVERYSFFGAGFDNLQGVNQENALITTDEELTDLGRQYIGLGMAPTSDSGSADGPPSGGEGVPYDGSEDGKGEAGGSQGNSNAASLNVDLSAAAFLVGLGLGIAGAGVL